MPGFCKASRVSEDFDEAQQSGLWLGSAFCLLQACRGPKAETLSV